MLFENKSTRYYKSSSTDFSSGYTNASPEVKITSDAVTNLQMIRFTLDKNYPNPDYELNFNPTIDNCQDVSGAFYDFINNSENKYDRSCNVIGVQEFSNEPMFCFKVNSDATSYNETLLVNVRLANNYVSGTSQLLVVALYNETLRLTFDSEEVVLPELIS